MYRRDFWHPFLDGLLAVAVLLAVAAALPGDVVRADDDDDDAEEAIELGAVAPPAALFDRIEGDFGGRVLRLELEPEHEGDGRNWVYDVKLLLADGQVIKVEYDAVTLEIIEVKGRRHDGSAGDDED